MALIIGLVIFAVGFFCLTGKNGVKTLASIYAMVIGLLPLGLFVLLTALILSIIF